MPRLRGNSRCSRRGIYWPFFRDNDVYLVPVQCTTPVVLRDTGRQQMASGGNLLDIDEETVSQLLRCEKISPNQIQLTTEVGKL